MVWGRATSLNHRTRLISINRTLTAQRYIDEVLHPNVLPFLGRHPEVYLFQQDNARSRRFTHDFLNANNIMALPWPYGHPSPRI